MELANLNKYYPALCGLLEKENRVKILTFYPSTETDSASIWFEYTLETVPKKYSCFIQIEKGLACFVYSKKDFSLFSPTVSKWLSQTRTQIRTSLLKNELFSHTLSRKSDAV